MDNQTLSVIAMVGPVLGIVLGYMLRHIDILRAHAAPSPVKKAMAQAQKAFQVELEKRILQQLGIVPPDPPATTAPAAASNAPPPSPAASPPAAAS